MARMRERRANDRSDGGGTSRCGDSTPRRGRPPSCQRRQFDDDATLCQRRQFDGSEDFDEPPAKPSMPSMPTALSGPTLLGGARGAAEQSVATPRGGARGLSDTMPTPRGGARGPAEVRNARAMGPSRNGGGAAKASDREDDLPPAAKGADFKTLQALIAKGIQENEEDGALLEASVGGTQWGKREELEMAEWRQAQQKRRQAEEDNKQKERERAREQRRRQDEERRRRQMEELERELMEEKRSEGRLIEEQDRQKELCSREFDAVKKIQAHIRGRRSRAGHTRESPSKSARWELHAEPVIPRT